MLNEGAARGPALRASDILTVAIVWAIDDGSRFLLLILSWLYPLALIHLDLRSPIGFWVLALAIG